MENRAFERNYAQLRQIAIKIVRVRARKTAAIIAGMSGKYAKNDVNINKNLSPKAGTR